MEEDFEWDFSPDCEDNQADGVDAVDADDDDDDGDGFPLLCARVITSRRKCGAAPVHSNQLHDTTRLKSTELFSFKKAAGTVRGNPQQCGVNCTQII